MSVKSKRLTRRRSALFRDLLPSSDMWGTMTSNRLLTEVRVMSSNKMWYYTYRTPQERKQGWAEAEENTPSMRNPIFVVATWCREFYPHTSSRHTLIGTRAHTLETTNTSVHFSIKSAYRHLTTHIVRNLCHLRYVQQKCVHVHARQYEKKACGNHIRTRPRPKHFWDPYCSLNALKVVPQCARTCLLQLYHSATIGWLTTWANKDAARTERGRSAHLLHFSYTITYSIFDSTFLCYDQK